ncbi:uncharacterized protein LOC122505686 [Leptopilina heterotoma]|uniref:uncharacterized protein LOC122505686 n=1 Tax=Leptopilina heterotoma TaxID=63436 RepID=UPI001CA922C8|nr:uncharacterized protein LOC122505686 [Leptopilina heterotoma]
MKPQKKAFIAKKATKPSVVVKKRRTLIEKSAMDAKKEKKSKKFETDKKKFEVEKKSPSDERKKNEEKRKDKLDKSDEKKKQVKDPSEKKTDKIIEKKTDDKNDDEILENSDKKKCQKSEGKINVEKTFFEFKTKLNKFDKTIEERTKLKIDEQIQEKKIDNDEKNITIDNKIPSFPLTLKKKNDKKKEPKVPKIDNSKGTKKIERKKTDGNLMTKLSASSSARKKDPKVKQAKKNNPKKTVLAKKSNPSVAKKFLEKKIKLVKCLESNESVTETNEELKKKKKIVVPKSKISPEKKASLEKQAKVKLPPKKLILKKEKEEKAKNLEKKKKQNEPCKDSEKILDLKEFVLESDIKKEVLDEKDCRETKEEKIKEESKKITKSTKGKCPPKKNNKKATKSSKNDDSNKEDSAGEETKADSSKLTNFKDQADNLVNLKVETLNGESTESSSAYESSSGDESWQNGKARSGKRKDRTRTPSDERARRMRLFGFWSGPKRHRVASLNALAKVHCLYENEAGGVYLGGFCKPKPEKEKQKKAKDEKDKEKEKEKGKEKEKEKEKEQIVKKEKDNKKNKNDDSAPKRKLRNVPGLRGKHWDMSEGMSSSSSSEEDCKSVKSEKVKKTITKRRKKNEEVMDLKDMVVCKRMASLNASAMLAASYSDEKIRLGSDSDSSSESEVEIIKRRRHCDVDLDKKRQGLEADDVIKPSKKVVIVNQDTDVTITGVYVNQTRSTHHEGFCSIAGMQYRISSTSHTQTAATAVATELHDQQKPEQPCKSYTPLGALSSMQPPGSQGNRSNMSPRRHSAFSAPHQHGYYQPAGPLIQHPPTLPPVKGPPPEPTPTPPQNSESSDDLVVTSASSGTSGAGFYRAYCPQYYGTPPQYQELCYPPTYTHPHPHPPPYYKYPPTYRRQYYGFQESGGGGGGPGGAGNGTGPGPGVVEYQPPPPPGEYPLPPYYAGYPPPPPPNPAYLHVQGRPFVDHAAFQSCPCPMQSCPKNVDTGPLIGNGKGAPVASGPGLSLPPSALVGPPSPARGLAGLAPPHGANAWDTDRVQLNPLRNLNQNQPSLSTSHNHVGNHNHTQTSECRTKDEKKCVENKIRKCTCQKHACTSTCEVKMESLSPSEKLSTPTTCPSTKIHNFKLENNNVKCESCSVEIGVNLSCAANCNVKCESDYKCEILKCEQCDKDGQISMLDMDKDLGILLIDEKLENDTEVKEELNDVVIIDGENWKKPDYEPTVPETVIDDNDKPSTKTLIVEEEPKTQKLTKRKLSLDSLSDSRKKRKVNKRTLSVGSTRDSTINEQSQNTPPQLNGLVANNTGTSENCPIKRKPPKKEIPCSKRKAENSNTSEIPVKKLKTSKSTSGTNDATKTLASHTSIMETINNVIQQSVQMTEKKDKKNKISDRVAERNRKNANLMSTIKKVTRKLELNSVIDKILPPKLETTSTMIVMTRNNNNNNQLKSKGETKSKPKIQDAKCKNKVKAKLLEVQSKISDLKSNFKLQEAKSREYLPKLRSSEIIEDTKKALLIKKKRKSTKKTSGKKTGGKSEDNIVVNEHLTIARKPFFKPKWSNGWSWEGKAYEAKVYLTNEESAIRRCYASMKHTSGDILRPRDCVLLRSGQRKADLPFVAKIAALWENPDDGEMMFSLLWYYRPEHTEQGRTEYDTEDEVFASRHRDANSVACIEDKCYILTFNEYCRYRKNIRRMDEGLEAPCLIVPPGDQAYPRKNRQPPLLASSDMVLFCRRVYDYRGRKLVKNPG